MVLHDIQVAPESGQVQHYNRDIPKEGDKGKFPSAQVLWAEYLVVHFVWKFCVCVCVSQFNSFSPEAGEIMSCFLSGQKVLFVVFHFHIDFTQDLAEGSISEIKLHYNYFYLEKYDS